MPKIRIFGFIRKLYKPIFYFYIYYKFNFKNTKTNKNMESYKKVYSSGSQIKSSSAMKKIVKKAIK